MLERWVEGTGGRLRYLDSASEETVGLPVLFSPGLSDTADEYEAAFAALRPRRLLVVEVRGRGRSDAPPTGYSADDHVDDLDAVVEHAGLDHFHLMTFSRGTTWGIDLARRRPSCVASVSIGDYRAVEVGLPPTFAESQWRTRFRGRPMPDRVAFHVLEGIARESRDRDLWEALGGLGVPVLVGRGAAGGILRDADVERYRAAVADIEVVTFDDAAHDLFRPDRTAYPRAVADFVARQVAETGGRP